MALNGRMFGFGSDRVRSLELVTKDGRLWYVDAVTEPELFWALCGGSGNLGIVTRMTVELVRSLRLWWRDLLSAEQPRPS